MPVPSAISDLSQTAASNSPAGSEDPTTTDDYLRALSSFLALLRDGKGLAAEVDLASGATCDIGGQNSPFVRITGTTTITSFGTSYNGPRFLRFSGALTLTHNASSLILPGGANITTAAGDTCIAIPLSGTGWYITNYVFATTQSWQDVTASRAAGSTYTNSTGRDIVVSANATGTVNASTCTISWTVGGVGAINQTSVITGTPASNTQLSAVAVVPPGASYSLALTQGSVTAWRELR